MRCLVPALLAVVVLAGGCTNPTGGPGPMDRAQVVVALGHRCVAKGGRVWCWGADSWGQTGQGVSVDHRPDPVPVPGLDSVFELAASDGHTCARLDGGQVACWGANAFSECSSTSAPLDTCKQFVFDAGAMNVPCQPTPTRVPMLADARQLALGEQRSCALLAGGAVRCWGQGARGADWAAMRFGVLQLAIGSQDGCVGQADGTLACSGGQPATIQRWTGVEQLAMAGRSRLACVRHAGGRVNCWGENASGQRGIGNFDPMIPLPEDPPAIDGGATALAVGWGHACALRGNGEVLCWGHNGGGAVGQPLPMVPNCPGGPCESRPRKVEGLPPAVSIAAGGDTTCAVTAQDHLYCWGALHDRNPVPTHVPGPWETTP